MSVFFRRRGRLGILPVGAGQGHESAHLRIGYIGIQLTELIYGCMTAIALTGVFIVIPNGMGNFQRHGIQNGVRVFADGEKVAAFLQHITPDGSVTVVTGSAVGCHVLCGEGQRHVLMLPRLNRAGFGKPKEYRSGLFDVILGIQLRIRRRHVKLHHLFSGISASSVCDPDGKGNPILIIPEFYNFLRIGGVAQTIAERVEYAGSPVIVIRQIAQVPGCLIVAVSQVNAFLILPEGCRGVRHPIGAVYQGSNGVGIRKPVCTVVLIGKGRCAFECRRPDIRGFPGGRDCARQDCPQRRIAAASRSAQPKDCVDSAVVLQHGNFHDRRRGQDNDDTVAVLLRKNDGFLFRRGQCQHMGSAVRVGQRRCVAVFTGTPADKNDSYCAFAAAPVRLIDLRGQLIKRIFLRIL